MDDAYTYPGSGGVLRNARDITDLDTLEQLEVTLATLAVEAMTIAGDPDFAMLSWIHREMFGDLYPWAGKLRTVPVSAAGEYRDVYCHPDDIADGVTELFGHFADQDYLRGLDQWDFLAGLDDFWARLTRLHPFRDGNTRSQVVLIDHVALQAGYEIDWPAVDPDRMRRVRISAALGNPNKIHWYLEDHELVSKSSTGLSTALRRSWIGRLH